MRKYLSLFTASAACHSLIHLSRVSFTCLAHSAYVTSTCTHIRTTAHAIQLFVSNLNTINHNHYYHLGSSTMAAISRSSPPTTIVSINGQAKLNYVLSLKLYRVPCSLFPSVNIYSILKNALGDNYPEV
jgi:spore coat protein U-like protein